MEPKAFYWYNPCDMSAVPMTAQSITEQSVIESLLSSGKIQLTEEETKRQEHKKNQEEAKAADKRAKKLYGNCKVVVNNPAVVLYVGDKQYKSVAADGDTFDAEKGLMMCILKWKGVTFCDIERLLKKAKVFNK